MLMLDIMLSAVKRVELVRAPSVLYLDPRVPLTNDQVELVKRQIRERIFVKGWNANLEQTLPALSYESPRGLYRYLTGTLYNSLVLRKVGNDRLVMEFQYPQIILAVLEDRYGVTFVWSDYEKEFVDKLQADNAKLAGLPPLGQVSETDVQSAKGNPDLERQIQEQKDLADKIAKQRDSQATNEVSAIERDKADYEKRKANRPPSPTERQPARAPAETPKGGTNVVYHEVSYDPRAPLRSIDWDSITESMKTRIRSLGEDIYNNSIPANIRDEIIDYRTINSLQIKRSRAGVLRLRVIYYDDTIPRLERLNKPVYNFALSELRELDEIVRIRLGEKDLQQTVSTQRIS